MKPFASLATLFAIAAMSTSSALANDFEAQGPRDYTEQPQFSDSQYNSGFSSIPPQFSEGFGEQRNAPSDFDGQYNDSIGNADAGLSRDW